MGLFCHSCSWGVEVEKLGKLETDKGAWLSYNLEEKGKHCRELIPDIFQTALDKLPIPKRMHWGDLEALFVRPVHWAIILLGDEVINANILSVVTSNNTRGHRFHHPQEINLSEPADYEKLLEGQVEYDEKLRQGQAQEEKQKAQA